MNAPALLTLPRLGAAMEGGLFHGCFVVDTTLYGLIVAPADAGELNMPWHESAPDDLTGAESAYDGYANTLAMVNAGSELAARIRALRIGDFDDWYLMSRGEALLAFAHRTEASAFDRDWYWTSTQVAGDAGYAWIQDFSDGNQLSVGMDWSCRARAVRRIPLQHFAHSVIPEAS